MEMFFDSANQHQEVDHPELLLPESSTYSAKDNAFLADDRCTTTYWGKNQRHECVAIRVWRENFWDREGRKIFLRGLERELLVWKQLTHPNIAPLRGLIFTYGKWASSVTPFYRHGTINHYLSSHPQMNPLALLCNVADGLAYLHSCTPPISHGDVRGRHIFIKDNDDSNDRTPTAVITNIGTNYLPTPPNWIISCDDGTRWMAPEVMNSESPSSSSSSESSVPSEEDRAKLKLKTTTESDVYSFGMTMLEVYTRRSPFPHRRFYSGVIYDVISGIRPPRPNGPGSDESMACAPGLGDEIWEVIQWCWRHDPRERPSMAAVANALRGILQRSDMTTTTTRSVGVLNPNTRRQASL